jgi:hypothetical protein
VDWVVFEGVQVGWGEVGEKGKREKILRMEVSVFGREVVSPAVFCQLALCMLNERNLKEMIWVYHPNRSKYVRTEDTSHIIES